jgi:glycerophosphoryl diester phosphodiesterase
MVHHDDVLGRLTEGSGRLDAMTAVQLRAVPFKATADRMQSLDELCALVAGRVLLLIELKSRFDGDGRLVSRVADVLRDYAGPVAVMSFDPAPVEALRWIAPALTRGIIAERSYAHPEWSGLPLSTRRQMERFSHAFRTRPHFLAYGVRDLPAAAPLIARYAFGLPLLTWTVRSADDRRRARWANQIIFEGFRP